MNQPIPYLSFNGQCDEAMRFYESALQARLTRLMRNAESPWAEHFSKASGQRVLHASLSLGTNGELYAGDCPDHLPYEGIKGVSLALNYATVEEATAVFHRLGEGGTVVMALQPTFWAKTWGMLVDRFGVSWIVNGERIEF